MPRRSGDYDHVSASLAINPSQIEEHQKTFPGVDVLPDGQIHFTSFKQHDEYLKKSGFVKQTQKRKTSSAVYRETIKWGAGGGTICDEGYDPDNDPKYAEMNARLDRMRERGGVTKIRE